MITPPPMPEPEGTYERRVDIWTTEATPAYDALQIKARDAQWMERITALEAENARLKDLLGKANTLARIRWERLCQLQGRSINEDNSDHHGPDWTDRESEYLK